MIEPTDLQVIGRLTAGDSAAFEVLDQRYRQRLHAFLRSRHQLTVDQADDVVQDVFGALVANECTALRAFEGRSSFYTYLCAIAIRRAYRVYRKQPELVDAADDQLPEPAADPTDAGLTAAQVRQAMSALPEQFRTALMLHHFGGMEYHEIADLLGVPANTVATRICRAKRRLRELLSP
jgi:RNA polymerase sigma-70 factor (ECF subfamily)